MNKEILVTGGAGFIGLNFVYYLLNNTSYTVTVIDTLTYASNSKEIFKLMSNPRFRFIKGNITNNQDIGAAMDRKYEVIVHFAAESHVDKSINNPEAFVQTNVVGTSYLLQWLLKGYAQRMIHISTDEVYGELNIGESAFTEETLLLPNNPYAATKASSDLLVRSFYKTFGLPLIITRCSNNFGPFQNKEKFVPTIIYNAYYNQKIPVYGDGMQIRDWIFVEDHCKAISLIIEKGTFGEIYNIGGGNEKTNLSLVKYILNSMGKSENLIEYVEDRKAHDRRYAINSAKIQKQLGWKPTSVFNEALDKTIEWHINKFKGHSL
ncbi:dTDP-glucose 4,6-dehydratase [Priestia aryabhattai]|uniref:dTDP-glucose 4,6-dehydratase n=1 Tax=Priestia aryabhattai TaxID=412384 RepID=UPI0008DD57CD|nr:dTDP-glucose 4,6-dehydratase [Priestia aryabhattai]OHY73457.1 dTDP-glucose 4,6-dehydratase [Priestia aryabhattai]